MSQDPQHPVIRPMPSTVVVGDVDLRDEGSVMLSYLEDGRRVRREVAGGYWELVYEGRLPNGDRDDALARADIINFFSEQATSLQGVIHRDAGNRLTFSIPRPDGGRTWCLVWAADGTYTLTIVDAPPEPDAELADGESPGTSAALGPSQDVSPAPPPGDPAATPPPVDRTARMPGPSAGAIPPPGPSPEDPASDRSAPKPEPKSQPTLLARFDFDAAESRLPAGAGATLDDIARRMGEQRRLRLQIHGYADVAEPLPEELSLRRAQVVADALTLYGVDPSRLIVTGMGIASEDTAARRVDLFEDPRP